MSLMILRSLEVGDRTSHESIRALRHYTESEIGAFMSEGCRALLQASIRIIWLSQVTLTLVFSRR